MKMILLLLVVFQQVEIFSPTGKYAVQYPQVLKNVVEIKKEGQHSQRRYLACFSASWCGPCQQWKRSVLPQLRAAGYHVELIDMDQPSSQMYKSKITRYPGFAVIDYKTGKWVSEPVFGGISLDTAKRMLGGSGVKQRNAEPVVKSVSPPVRFIDWPGWGQIDLETYNRNCTCSMCVSIRRMQQEYRRQMEAYRASSQVTPDQEGCPHDLVEEMLDRMDLRPDDVLGDMGCGDGRILIAAAKRGIRGIGVEIDPQRADLARKRVLEAGVGDLVTIETGDALEFDFSRITAVTAYLYPPLLAKLSPRLVGKRSVASPYHEIPGLSMVRAGDVWTYHGGG